ncbi:GlmU family protein [Chlorobaculum sp. MV4-Y]|uniref:GlmU family protein n=1 Tax=Chlorobaculum sp. MV4-Y TaxID=2976335 RepID=UPI0021B07ADB|nr:GlmU family protein [Chlorobaculum sp. MV4-Y]UWX58192.1 GlmU family protein [Chlorobaculum sp. MV4-Y]
MQVIIFEDEKTPRFTPLADLKPVYNLVTGCHSLRERFVAAFGGRQMLTWHLRRHIAPWFAEANPGSVVNSVLEDEVLLVNGRLICDAAVTQFIDAERIALGEAIVQNGNLLFCRTKAEPLHVLNTVFPDTIDGMMLAGAFSCVEVSGFRLIENLWDPVTMHPAMMREDGEALALGRIDGEVHPSAILVNPSAITVEKGAEVKAGAVLDASDGFIFICARAVVEPVALLMENVFIAPGARVKSGARIYSNVFVGGGVKAGGEIEDSIMEPFSNKQHDGFLGHSYISSWCNLGAGTDTSDLKNNYSQVSIETAHGKIATGQQFLGLLMGEHSKCSIGTRFNTGTVVGTSSNIFGNGMPAKYVPSFSWGDGNTGTSRYEADKAVETARKVMARRKVEMSAAYEEMLRAVAGESE